MRRFKTAFLWILLVVIFVFIFMERDRRNGQQTRTIPADSAVNFIAIGRIDSYHVTNDQIQLESSNGTRFSVQPPMSVEVLHALEEAGVPYEAPAAATDYSVYLFYIIPVIVILAIVYFVFRRMGSAQMNEIAQLRKSKARTLSDSDKAKFLDIGGNREAVELLEDVVDFLRAPDRWSATGARAPRGILMVGPPGTGKTLLARAVAGETNSAFFYTSASEFVEMFVGVGAARIRDTFEKAAAEQPAVIFIDELDAVGRRRGSGVGTMHEEREQTLNQLLVLMDGLERHARLVVMAATNRIDILDPALLRSGRFDHTLHLEPPPIEDRVDILRIHTRNKTLAPDVSLERVARETDGFTGADLEALANKATLLAIRRTRHATESNGSAVAVSMADFLEAKDVMLSSTRKFDRLDAVLVESVSQFAEPVGRAVVRMLLSTGDHFEGEVIWMNSDHVKLRLGDGSDSIIAKKMVVQIVPLPGTESTVPEDFQPDRWAGRSLDVG